MPSKPSPNAAIPFRYAVPLIAAAHAALAFFLAWKLNIWLDESYSMRTTDPGFAQTWRNINGFEMQPPSYFVLLWFWRRLNPIEGVQFGIFFARVLSIFFTTAFVFVSAAVSRRYWSAIHPAWFAAIAAFHPQTLHAAVEIRRYGLTYLINAALLLLFHRAFLAGETPRRRRIDMAAYAALAVLALYTDYYTGFLLAAAALPLALLKRWRDLGAYLLAMAIVGIVFLPLLLQIPGQVSGHDAHIKTAYSLAQRVEFLDLRMRDFLAPLLGDGWFNRIQKLVWMALGSTVIVGAVWRYPRMATPERIAMLCVGALLPLIFGALLGIVHADMIAHRHMAVALLPALLAVGIVALALDIRFARACFGIVLACEIASVGVKYKDMAKPGDYIRAAQYIQDNEQPGEPILIYAPDAALPFRYYYRGVNRLIPIPKEYPPDRYVPGSEPFESPRQISDAMGEDFAQAKRIWLLADDYLVRKTILGTNLNVEVIEEFLDDNYELIETRKLSGGQVRHYRKKPQPIYSAQAP